MMNTFESEKESVACDSEVFIREHHPAPPPTGRLIVKRGGHSITRIIPKPIVIVDTREKNPFDFSRFKNWIGEERSQALKVGDYSIEGMEELLVLERKTLTDLITTLIQQRERFFKQCEKMTKYRWRALLIEASYEDIKSSYDQDEYNTSAHPNAVSGTLDALEAGKSAPRRHPIPVHVGTLFRNMPAGDSGASRQVFVI